MRIHFLIILVIGAFLMGCGGDGTPSAFKVKPKALGKMNEIVVVNDDLMWDGAVGDSLTYYLGGPFPIIPSEEPIFDLRHFDAEQLKYEVLLRGLRSYLILANLSDTTSETTKMVIQDLGEEKINELLQSKAGYTSVGKDKWATGQLLIYLIGHSEDQLMELIRKNFDNIVGRVHQHDEIQLRSLTYSRGSNLGLSKEFSEKYGVEIDIPADYIQVPLSDTSNYKWLRKETPKGTISLVFSKQKYTGIGQVTTDNLINIRDDFGKKYVSSQEIGSYMRTNYKDLPVLEYTKNIDGLYAKEFRGIWEMENDFMGGPFLSYLIVNEATSELIYIDGFIFGPGEKKRDSLLQLEYIASRIKSKSKG